MDDKLNPSLDFNDNRGSLRGVPDVADDRTSHISLRDWFAGQAIGPIISLSQNRDGGWAPNNVAAGCYAVADAMLEARK